MTNSGKRLLVSLFVALTLSVSADKAPPGSSMFLADDNGWSGWVVREGTTGTMWDEPTTTFSGVLEFVDKKQVATSIEFYRSKSNRLLIIRVDSDTETDAVVKRCVYTGTTNREPKDHVDPRRLSLFEKLIEITKAESESKKIYGVAETVGGTYFCSDMKFEGVWFGLIKP